MKYLIIVSLLLLSTLNALTSSYQYVSPTAAAAIKGGKRRLAQKIISQLTKEVQAKYVSSLPGVEIPPLNDAGFERFFSQNCTVQVDRLEQKFRASVTIKPLAIYAYYENMLEQARVSSPPRLSEKIRQLEHLLIPSNNYPQNIKAIDKLSKNIEAMLAQVKIYAPEQIGHTLSTDEANVSITINGDGKHYEQVFVRISINEKWQALKLNEILRVSILENSELPWEISHLKNNKSAFCKAILQANIQASRGQITIVSLAPTRLYIANTKANLAKFLKAQGYVQTADEANWDARLVIENVTNEKGRSMISGWYAKMQKKISIYGPQQKLIWELFGDEVETFSLTSAEDACNKAEIRAIQELTKKANQQ